MEEIDHLTERVKQLTDQVKMLAESVQLMLTRSEQLFKMQETRLESLPQLETHLSSAIEEIESTNEALLDSLNESDGAIDDLKKATAAQLLIVEKMKALAGQNANPITQ